MCAPKLWPSDLFCYTTADLKQEYDPFHYKVKKRMKDQQPSRFSLKWGVCLRDEWGWATLTSEQFFHSTASYQAILNSSFSHFCTVANIQSAHCQFFLFHSHLCPLCIVPLWRSVPSVAPNLHMYRKRQILREPVCWEKNQHSVFLCISPGQMDQGMNGTTCRLYPHVSS